MLPAAQNDCFVNMSQDYLICTTIHKARQLGIFTGETFVRVSLDKSHRTTRPYSRSENPYFNEYFVFELRCTTTELLRLTVLYEVRRRNACKKTFAHGELLIDMQSVWNQPNRCYFKKWGRLEGPIAESNNTPGACKGYLQIDLAIVSQTTDPNTVLRPQEAEMLNLNKWQINQDYDNIERNLLQHTENSMQCNIRYTVTFYRAYLIKKGDYIVQVSYAGFNGKTNMCKSTNNPEWNHAVNFAWTFPSLSQTFLIQVLVHEHLQWKSIADYELHFDEISFKDKPAMGPTYLHFYDATNPTQYIGRLLLEVHSECLPAGPARDLTTRPAPPLDDKRWWQEETFLIEFIALQGDFMHGNVSNCKIHMKLAENTSNTLECFLKAYRGKSPNANCSLKYFRQDVPYKAIYLKATMPDNRYKFDSDYFMQEILDYIETEITTFKLFQLKYNQQFQMQAKCLKAIIMNVYNKIMEGLEDKRMEYMGFKDPTPWDTNRLMYLKEFLDKLPEALRGMRQKLKSATLSQIEMTLDELVDALLAQSAELRSLLATTRIQDEWPNLLIMLSFSGNREVGVCRLNAKYFLSPPKDKAASPNSLCWRMRNFIFKVPPAVIMVSNKYSPDYAFLQDIQCQHSCVHCGCIVGIVQGTMGIVVETERDDYLVTLLPDWKQTELFYWTPSIPYILYKCRLFIHQAKIRPGGDRSGLCDGFLRIIFGSQWAETSTEMATLSPIWNTVICFDTIVQPGDMQWYVKNPPLIAIELYDLDKFTSNDYLGCGTLAASVISSDMADANAREEPDKHKLRKIVKTRTALQKFKKLKTLSPPPLMWVPIAMHGGIRAEVLMSAELVEMHDEVNKDSIPEPTITSGIPSSIRPIMKNFVLEVIFVGFRNYTKTTFGGRHRVKVMMGDLLLTSGLSSTRIKNSINFLVIFASGVVSLPEQLEYWPAIIATDVAVSTRGGETTLGAVLISDSKRFLHKDKARKCVPSAARLTTLQLGDMDNSESVPLLNKPKLGFFKRLLSRVKKAKKIDKSSLGKQDMSSALDEAEYNWWTKFYNSMHTNMTDGSDLFKHRLVIYHSELEKQADLSYLHDWAEPVKLVHGVKYKKNAMPKEEVYATLKLNLKLMPCQCGAGDGGDGVMLRPLAAALNPRYQAELQTLADLCKIVVRVYVVQGIQLRPQDRQSQSDSYVKVSFASKTACNRAHYVPNESNPVFGKCFQLEGVLPRDHNLEVSVFDRNTFCDDIIGSTIIDLEDRWRSKHRATIGLAEEYCKSGYNKWRDVASPYELLNDLCSKHDIPLPKFKETGIEVDGVTLEDDTTIALDEELQERLSLVALRNLEQLPSFGYKLTPEHVETRTLYRNDCPGIEQGKIQLWVELYEGNLNIPQAIDITPQPPQMYELRVIIFNLSDVTLDDRNIFGRKMSDVLVRGWCHDTNQVQSTDIHYRSMNGEANFNWRMIFPVKYSPIEDMMVIKHRSGVLEEFELKHPPVLYLQVFDNDVVSSNDFLGMIEINLSHLPEPCQNRRLCKHSSKVAGFKIPERLNKMRSDVVVTQKTVNLFRKKRVKGWLPLHGPIKDKIYDVHTTGQTGLIELELEILTEAEAAGNPVGLGRSPPKALAEPSRPDTSFNPLLHPIKAFRHILMPVLIKFLLVAAGVVVVVMIFANFFATLPAKIMGLL